MYHAEFFLTWKYFGNTIQQGKFGLVDEVIKFFIPPITLVHKVWLICGSRAVWHHAILLKMSLMWLKNYKPVLMLVTNKQFYYSTCSLWRDPAPSYYNPSSTRIFKPPNENIFIHIFWLNGNTYCWKYTSLEIHIASYSKWSAFDLFPKYSHTCIYNPRYCALRLLIACRYALKMYLINRFSHTKVVSFKWVFCSLPVQLVHIRMKEKY